MKFIDSSAKTNWKFLPGVIILAVVTGIGLFTMLNYSWFPNQETPAGPGLEPAGLSSEYTEVTTKDLKKDSTAYHNQKIMVSGTYWWGSEADFEEDSFGESINEEPIIWLAIEKGNVIIENNPSNYASGAAGVAEVTVYGTFQANYFSPSSEGLPPTSLLPPRRRGSFWHLGLWKHRIVANKIVFGNTIDASIFQQKVAGLTNRLIYSSGEKISVTIRNDLKNSEGKDIWILVHCTVPFILQKQNGPEWEDYGSDPTKKCAVTAQQVEVSGQMTYQINLKQKYEHTYFQIEPGTYRFSFLYSLANPDLVGQRVQFFDAFSNEFTIVEKQAAQHNARIVGSYNSAGESSKVAVLGDVAIQQKEDRFYIYVADDRDDLQIIEVRR